MVLASPLFQAAISSWRTFRIYVSSGLPWAIRGISPQTVKDGGEWKIVTYHNVDVKPGVTAPEPQ
jgi:hypothetical protein